MLRLLSRVGAVGLVASLGQDVQWRPRFVAGDEFTIDMIRTIEERLGEERNHAISRTGLSHPVGQELEMPATFPIPGDSIPGVRRLRIVSADNDKAEATMAFTLDPVALRKLLPTGVETASIKFDLTETARYVFDRKVGLNRAGTMDRTATMAEDRRIERWEFSLSSAPKR